jgi:hypothetical protein
MTESDRPGERSGPYLSAAERAALDDLHGHYGRRYAIHVTQRPGGLTWHAGPLGGGTPLTAPDAGELRQMLRRAEAGTPSPNAAPPRPCSEVTLGDVRARFPSWRMAETTPGRFTATSGDGLMSVTARSPKELETLLDGEAWKPRTARNPGLPPGAG